MVQAVIDWYSVFTLFFKKELLGYNDLSDYIAYALCLISLLSLIVFLYPLS